MPRRTVQAGTLRQYTSPNWLPLEKLIGYDLADWFMWMHELTLDDGTPVHAYKHVATRCYFHLGEDGRAFAYTRGGRYASMDPGEAIDGAFDGWENLLPAPDDPDAVRADLRRAREAATVGG